MPQAEAKQTTYRARVMFALANVAAANRQARRNPEMTFWTQHAQFWRGSAQHWRELIAKYGNRTFTIY